MLVRFNNLLSCRNKMPSPFKAIGLNSLLHEYFICDLTSKEMSLCRENYELYLSVCL